MWLASEEVNVSSPVTVTLQQVYSLMQSCVIDTFGRPFVDRHPEIKEHIYINIYAGGKFCTFLYIYKGTKLKYAVRS